MDDARSERRLVTLLFSDLTDSTGISAGLEPEQFADVLEQIRVIANRIVPAHGGEIIRVDGDGMLCVFGFPDAHEDAGRRATEAALDLHAAMAALEAAFVPLSLHTGIHAGLVLVRNGDIVRGKFEVLGDATNVAARLCDQARPGEILVSADTLGGERHFFTSGDVRPVMLKGRKTPLATLSVSGRAGLERRFETRERAGLTPFQGRQAECDIFEAWLSDDSAPAMLLALNGPAGIGKSRLLAQFADLASKQGWTVAQGYCEAYLGARPLQPFRQAVATLLGSAGASDIPVDELRADALGHCIERQRAILFLDDWQWADDASRDLLTTLFETPGPCGLRIVLASREAGAGSFAGDHVKEIPLPPLDRDTTLDTIETLLASPDPFVVDRIEQASGGSPLLIEELCHAFASGSQAPDADPRGAWFDLAVQTRFRRLQKADRELLKLSAVVGHMIPVWLIEHLLGAPLDAGQMARLQSVDFLFPSEANGTYRFKHGLTRDALYAGLGRDERRALHGRVFAALEAGVPDRARSALLDQLAYHAVAAGDPVHGLPLSIEAGDAALVAGALDRAQAHYLAATGLLADVPVDDQRRQGAWSLLNKFGLACIVDPARDQLAVLEGLQQELQRYGDARDLRRADYWLGSIAYGVGLGKRAVRHLSAALEGARAAGDDKDVRLVRTKLAHALFASGRVSEAIAEFDRELPELAKAARRNERELAAYAYAGFAFLMAVRGNHAVADDLFSNADAILADPANAMNASILLYRSAALISQGAWEKAIEAAAQVQAVSQRSRARMQSRTSRAQAAYARWKLAGDPADIQALELIAREFLVSGHSRQHASMVFGWVVEACTDLGNDGLARTYMGEVLRRVREGGDCLGEAMGWRAMASAALAKGHHLRADRYLFFAQRSAESRLSRSEAAHNAVCAAQIAQARGEPEEAERQIRSASRTFEQLDMPFFRDHALTSRRF